VAVVGTLVVEVEVAVSMSVCRSEEAAVVGV
jgi:hypothetical protein